MNGNAFTKVGFSLGGPAMSVAENLAVVHSFAHECHPVKPASHEIRPQAQIKHTLRGRRPWSRTEDYGRGTMDRGQHILGSALSALGPSLWALAFSGVANVW